MDKHESGGLSPAHDVAIFFAWKQAAPEYKWSRAEVDRSGGLTLFDNSFGMKTSLHFPKAVCGSKNKGSQATVTILREAGFGNFNELSVSVFSQERCSFTK